MEVIKTIKCEKCNFENLEHTAYCQRCGNKLRQKKTLGRLLKSLDLKDIAGAGAKGVSAAPMAGRVIEDQAKEISASGGTRGKGKAKVLPLSDGTWFCPDCGEHNRAGVAVCKGCGRSV